MTSAGVHVYCYILVDDKSAMFLEYRRGYRVDITNISTLVCVYTMTALTTELKDSLIYFSRWQPLIFINRYKTINNICVYNYAC